MSRVLAGSSTPDVALVSVYPEDGVRHGGASGVASYTANLAQALAGQGATVHVVAAREEDTPSRTLDGPVRVERVFRRGAAAVPSALVAAHRTGAPVVHLQFELFLYGGAPALPGLFAALAAARRSRVRTVVTAHQVVDPSSVDDGFVGMHGIRLPAAAARAALAGVQFAIGRLPHATIVHEPSFAEQLPRAAVIPHGIERVRRADRSVARSRLGLDGDRLVALCFGFVAPYKGLELACAAAALAGEQVRLVVAGGRHPRHRDDAYGAGLRSRYGDRVRFAGYVPEEEIPSWFAAADLVLLPYPHPHASSGALALALAHGTPVLLSSALAQAIGAPALAGPGDPEGLARRLRRLAADPEELDALSEAGRDLREGRSWPEVARRHLDLYREVIHERPAPTRLASAL